MVEWKVRVRGYLVGIETLGFYSRQGGAHGRLVSVANRAPDRGQTTIGNGCLGEKPRGRERRGFWDFGAFDPNPTCGWPIWVNSTSQFRYQAPKLQ